MAPQGLHWGELPDKVWLPWQQEGPFLARYQHLVARDEDQVSLCPVPIGQQLRSLVKLTLGELQTVVDPPVFEAARQVASRLVEGRPYRLLVRDLQAQGRSPEQVEQGLMALCRAGLVTVFFRNRRRSVRLWEVRHAQLTNWGRAVLIALDAVYAPGPRPAGASRREGAGARAGGPSPGAPPSALAEDTGEGDGDEE